MRNRILMIIVVTSGVIAFSHSGGIAGAKNSDETFQKAIDHFARSSIVQKKNCITCHTIGTSGGTVGPILNQVANRRTEAWLRKWLKNPNSLKPSTKMPNFQFNDQELNQLVADMKGLRRSFDPEKILAANPDPVQAGEKLFQAYDCFACHRIGKKGRFVGPNLTWVGWRKSRDWETVWLRNPPAYKPGTFMPNFKLSEKEISALTAFLHSLQGQKNEEARKWESMTAFILDARPRERGHMVAERLACWSCHGENLEGGVKNPNASPDGMVPAINTAYVDLSEEELRDIILNGSTPEKLDANGETPPFKCPGWKKALTEDELQDLLAYLGSIVPESAKWEFQ